MKILIPSEFRWEALKYDSKSRPVEYITRTKYVMRETDEMTVEERKAADDTIARIKAFESSFELSAGEK